MKINCLAVLLASAMSASAAPFSLTVDHEANCNDLEELYGACMVDKGDVVTDTACLATCFAGAEKLETCDAGCELTNKCGAECTPACTDKLLALVNCRLDRKLGPDACICSAAPGVNLSTIETFVLTLSRTLKKSSNLRA